MTKLVVTITCALACAAEFVLQIAKAFPVGTDTPLHLALAVGWLGVMVAFTCAAIRDILDRHDNTNK